jgi:hypothetical protein
MAPRAALRRPETQAHAAPATRRVGFNDVARAKPADGGDSFATQVHFSPAQRPPRRGAGASTSRPSQPPAPHEQSHEDIQREPEKKSSSGFLNRLLGGARGKGAQPSTGTGAPAALASPASPGPHTQSPIQRFNTLLDSFMYSRADYAQKVALHRALEKGQAGVEKFANTGGIKAVADDDARRTLIDLVHAYRAVGPDDQFNVRVLLPSRDTHRRP